MSDSSRNLKLLNAVIAMCRSDSKWPHYFFDLGYGVKWIEQPFTGETGEKLVPDLVIVSKGENHCILFEGKSGNNIENEQAQRYMQVRPKDVVSKLFVDLVRGKHPMVDVSYLCFSESTPTIVAQLNALSATFPVLEMSASLFRLAENQFSLPKINQGLSTGISVDINKIPMGYFPFDEDSSDSEIAPRVMQTVVSFARQNKPHFGSEEITQDTIGSLWQHFGTAKKRKLTNRVTSVLGKAQVRELNGFLKKQGAYWSLSYNFPTSRAFPTRRLESLSKNCKRFVKRLRDEERAEGRQLPLFVLDES